MNGIKYRSADEMKDSGIQWIGQIPSEWFVERIQHLFRFRTEKVSDKLYEALSVTKNGITKQLDNVAKTDDGDNRKRVMINDFVINSRADRKGSCGVSPYNGSVSLICHVLEHTNRILPMFSNHMLRSNNFSEEFYRWGTGIVDDLWSTNIDRMSKISLPIPCIPEQRKIANFLDIKTAQFDSIIAKKEQLIAKLEEAKKSLISEVVTGKVKIVDGQLVPRQPEEMKDSGVEWLGKIPKDWKHSKVKFELDFYDNKRIPLSSEERGKISDKIYDYYGASGVIDQVDNYIFNGTYILVGEDGANLYSRSSPLAFLAMGKFWVNNHAHILKSKNDQDKFYVHLLESIDYFNNITGSAQPKLTQENLGSIVIFVPKYEEQNYLSSFLDTKLEELNRVVLSIENQINAIKSAKQSLISEAVTGKIDLRDWEIIEQGGAS